MKYLDTTDSTNFHKNESELINDILFARKWISYRENEVPLKTLKKYYNFDKTNNSMSLKDNLTADELIELTELEYGEYYSFWTFYNIESDIEQVEFHTYPTDRYNEYIQDLHIAKNALDFSDEIDSINSGLEDINLEDIKYSLGKLKICPEYKETKQKMQDIQDLVDDFKEELENKIEDLYEYSDKK